MIDDIISKLGIPANYANGRPRFTEPEVLVDVGPNIVGRTQSLTPAAASAWDDLVAAAAGDSVVLLIVSGFRGVADQARLFIKKLNKGQTIEQILRVNAAPGFSQHHTGCAIDIATPGVRPLTEEFESSDAFLWLRDNAERFGFSMPYTRDNEWGLDYEPWHWFFDEESA